jgi:nuclear RNA export factor
VVAPNPSAYQTLLGAAGVRFAGKSLQVQPSQNRSNFNDHNQNQAPQAAGFSNTHTRNTYDILKEFLSRRYNAEVGLLDLSKLAADETLRGAGFFNSATTQAKLFPALMRVADENISKQGGVVVSISLAENGLRDVRSVEGLANTFPNLKVHFPRIANGEFESAAKQHSPVE